MRHNVEEAIADNLCLIHGKNEGRFPYSHSILVLDKDTALIDTGCGIETLRYVRKNYDIDYVVNSHTHPDHSAGNWIFKDKPIHVPEEGFDTSGNLVALSKRFVDKELAPVWQHFVKRVMSFKNCRPTHTYNSQTIFNFGNIALKPIHTPGHTKDHYCFYEQSKRILFSFDYDLTSFPWYGHKESSLLEFRETVKELAALSPNAVVSSHKGIIAENIDEEFDNFHKNIEERDEKILSLLKNQKTFTQLVDCTPIYGKLPYAKSLLQYWEGQMIRKHLEQLKIEGRVRMCGDLYSKAESGL